jgi:hypothetical protein
LEWRPDVRKGAFAAGWNQQPALQRPQCSDRYGNGKPLKPTRTAIRRSHVSLVAWYNDQSGSQRADELLHGVRRAMVLGLSFLTVWPRFIIDLCAQ